MADFGIDFLSQAPSADDVKGANATATVAPAAPEQTGFGLDFLNKPVEQRSASEIVQRGEFANRNWKDTAAELKKAGYAAPDEIGTQYTQRQALRAEKEKQGQGVGTFEQFGRHGIPFVSSVIGGRRESANYEATQRFQQGKATPEDMQTIAAYQRRQEADRQINSTHFGGVPVGQLLSIPLAAPAVIGESLGAGKLLGLGGKALGIGQTAAQSTGRAVLNFAGKQAIATPLVPSLYIQKANEINQREGRNPNDIRGYAPAVALAYSQMLVLGSLQKFGNTGSFADQIVQKGAIGVGEQAIADTGISAIDEFLPKAYKTGTRYGVLGDLARGNVGEGLKAATTQMLTFSYFAALHGKHDPHAIIDAGKDLLDANQKARMPPDRAAAYQLALGNRFHQAVYEAGQQGKDFTREDATALFSNLEATKKGLTPEQFEATKNYVDQLTRILPKKGGERDYRLSKRADVDTVDEQARMGDEGPVHEAPEPEAPLSLTKVEPPIPEGHVRLYHGGFDPTSGGSRWVTGDRAYAERYGNKENEVHHVDLPETHPLVKDALDAAEQSTGRRDIKYAPHFEVPAEIAKRFKSLGKRTSETNVDVWDGTGKVSPDTTQGPPKAPESTPVDPIDAMHPQDRADLAKLVGVKESHLKDEWFVDRVRKMAETINADRARREKPAPAPEQAPVAAEPGAPARSAGEENTPSRGEESPVRLAEGRVTGEKDHQGNPLTVHDLVDSQGKTVGDAKVFQSGGTLHVHWIGVKGMAGGEGRGSNPIGARELLRLLPELAKAYPDAVVAKYTPANGRIKAGETKWIDLEKVRQRGAVTDRRAAQTEDHPGRRDGESNAVAKELTPETPAESVPPSRAVPEPVKRSIPREQLGGLLNRGRERNARFAAPGTQLEPTNAQGRAEEADAEARLQPPSESMPQTDRLRLNAAVAKLTQSNVVDAPLKAKHAVEVYRRYGSGALNDFVAGLELVAMKAEMRASELRGEKPRELTEEEHDALEASRETTIKEDVANARDYLDRINAKRAAAASGEVGGSERPGKPDAKRAFEAGVQDANAVADATIGGIGTSPAPQPQKPRRKAGAKLTPAEKVQKVADKAGGEAKDVLESAIHNSDGSPKDLARTLGRSIEEASANRDGSAIDRRSVPAATIRAVQAALTALGAEAHGPARGATTEHSNALYQPLDAAFSGDKVVVVRPPLTLNGEVVSKGVVAKPKTNGGKAPTKGQTLLQYIRGYGGIDSNSMSPRERALLGEDQSGLHLVFQNEKMGKGTNSIDVLAEHLIHEGYLQADPKLNHTDVLIEALKKNKVVNESHQKHDADLHEYLRQQEEAHQHQRAAEGKPEEPWRPSEEEIPFATEPGKEVLGGARPSLTKVAPGAFEIIAEQNKLFDVRNYVEKSVPYNKAALAVALREQEATVTSKIAAGDPIVNLHEHAHHIAKAMGLPETPDGLPLVVARGAQALFRPDGPGVPTAEGMREAFPKWLALRSTGGLTGLSREQQVASEYYERWAAEKGLTKTFDHIRDLYTKYQGRPAAEQAAANVSATGKPVQADRTYAEVATSISQKAQEVVDDNLTVLQRVIASANKAGHAVGQRLYNAYSQLMHAAPKLAAQFEKEGVHGYDKDGRRIIMGESWDKIVADAKPEWLRPGANGEASKAGTYAIVRHILGEEARGRKELVSEVQLEQARRALEEFHKDAEFAAWAKPFAERLTAGFNASNRALASPGVHFYSKEEVDASEKKYPDYVPTTRVMQDAGWKAGGGTKGEIIGKGLHARSGSGEQIVDPLISYKNRLAQTASRMSAQLMRKELFKVLELPGMGDWAVLGEKSLTQLGKERAERLAAIGFKGEDLKRLLENMGSERDEEYFTTKPWPTDGTKPTLGMMGPDGNLVTARIGNKALYDLATGQQVEASALASWLKTTGEFYPIKFMTQAVKFGATSASLGFQFRNVPRDIYTFWSNTIDRTKANPRDLGDAYKRAFAFAWHQLTGHIGYGPSTDALFRRFESDRGEGTRQFDFDRNNPSSAYAPDRGKAVQTAHTIWGILRDTLRLAGSGELAPRFLEWKTRLQQTTGKTEAQLTAELEAAEKAAAEGRPVPDPIPLAVSLDALQHASEVTVNFNRLGTVTREVNKITPFFGPAIAGLSKQLRNWKENPKGAAFALSGLLAARLIHWALYSDEDWYKELSANDRFNNFVVPTPAGLRRFPAPRGLEVAGGGFLTTVLEAAAKQNPDVKGYLKESFGPSGALAPPFPVPPALKVGYEIAKNENWMGSPIVPKREEATSGTQKLLNRQLPYAADQMTGGLLSERKIPKEAKDLIPYTEVRNARRSVDTFYERLKELEAGHQDARQKGTRFADEAEYKRLEATGHKITELSRAVRGERLVNGRVVKGEEPPEEKKAELRKRQVELARQAMGK